MCGNVLNKSRCGRPHKLSDRDARVIVRKVKKNPKISAPKLADQIATASGKKVHTETVRRIIRLGGYNGRVSSRKPFISSVKQQKRLDSASPHQFLNPTPRGSQFDSSLKPTVTLAAFPGEIFSIDSVWNGKLSGNSVLTFGLQTYKHPPKARDSFGVHEYGT
ncbi:hypothetical protein TNIN_103241 [Trichonephila inaurata madagascariensis]|uniref:Transposase Tc1-like domain-containing protein n=1 Tax=Trichonephila inaurata madagascariensis TaxID=2747483 RepID=A0A8X6IBK5_9ARAC|nr:hypothetical protein TNIN_103241 [Trichonephila inaurata madagascariensis]